MLDILARWIMDRAIAHPPREREAWAEAMRAEFDAASADRLGWAVGCWWAMAGWRLSRDWFYLIIVATVAASYVWTVLPPIMAALSSVMPGKLFGAIFIPLGFGLQVLPALVLSAWRPDYFRTTALAIALIPTLQVVLMLHRMSGGWFEPGWQYFNGPVLIGAAALLGACWAGAWAVAAVSSRVQSRRRFSAT